MAVVVMLASPRAWRIVGIAALSGDDGLALVVG
jgi:hypothetical protein